MLLEFTWSLFHGKDKDTRNRFPMNRDPKSLACVEVRTVTLKTPYGVKSPLDISEEQFPLCSFY